MARGQLLQGSELSVPAVSKTGNRKKAKAVIQIWLGGGPSHLDTFDPKPGAGRDYCGPYTKALATNVAGIEICQMLPLLAKMADKYTLLRGMTHGNNGHETATYLVQAGRKPDSGLVCPGIGAIVSYFNGYNGGYKGKLPPYITVTSPPPQGPLFRIRVSRLQVQALFDGRRSRARALRG